MNLKAVCCCGFVTRRRILSIVSLLLVVVGLVLSVGVVIKVCDGENGRRFDDGQKLC